MRRSVLNLWPRRFLEFDCRAHHLTQQAGFGPGSAEDPSSRCIATSEMEDVTKILVDATKLRYISPVILSSQPLRASAYPEQCLHGY